MIDIPQRTADGDCLADLYRAVCPDLAPSQERRVATISRLRVTGVETEPRVSGAIPGETPMEQGHTKQG